jgi:hypothetical protein
MLAKTTLISRPGSKAQIAIVVSLKSPSLKRPSSKRAPRICGPRRRPRTPAAMAFGMKSERRNGIRRRRVAVTRIRIARAEMARAISSSEKRSRWGIASDARPSGHRLPSDHCYATRSQARKIRRRMRLGPMRGHERDPTI